MTSSLETVLTWSRGFASLSPTEPPLPRAQKYRLVRDAPALYRLDRGVGPSGRRPRLGHPTPVRRPPDRRHSAGRRHRCPAPSDQGRHRGERGFHPLSRVPLLAPSAGQIPRRAGLGLRQIPLIVAPRSPHRLVTALPSQQRLAFSAPRLPSHDRADTLARVRAGPPGSTVPPIC